MDYKAAIEYLRPVADNHPVSGYGAALEAAIRALEEAETLGRMIDQLKRDLKESGRKDPCSFCRFMYQPVPCEGADYICDECSHESCVCHGCRGFDKWEWRGVPEEGRNETL